MPTAANTSHRTFKNTALPFVTNSQPLSVDPQYIGGSNAVTSIQGKTEKRAGFSAPVEVSASQFPAGETIKNIFQWRRWAGAFVTMVCTTTAVSSKVYAYRSGTDNNFFLLYTATAADGKAFSFAVGGNNTCYMANGTAADNRAYDATGVTSRKWGITKPAAAPTTSTVGGGALNIYRSFKHLCTFCNSSTGHESSPSDVSTCVGVLTGVNVHVVVTASTDPQVDQIRVYRTTDGGSSDPPDMREITGSPFANVSATITDSTLDTALGIRVAPENNRNDPPPGMEGIIFLEVSSRIAGFSGATAYYSGFEEIANGVPYECFPSGLDGNNVPVGSEITAISQTGNGAAIFTASSIVAFDGDSLDTFRRYLLARRQGTRSYRCVASLGNLCVWLDTADTIFMLGGDEIGKDIRPTLSGIDHTKAQLTIHIEGSRRWLLVLDGGRSKVYAYDFDTEQWLPPWNVSATSIHSGETSVGQFSLMAGMTSRKVLMQTEGSFNDDGVPFGMSLQTGMLDISPEAKPDWRGAVDFVDIKRNAAAPLSDVSQLNDDDPTLSTYTSIFANREDQPLVPQGVNVKQERFTSAPTTNVTRITSVTLTWPAADVKAELYYMDIGYHGCGG